MSNESYQEPQLTAQELLPTENDSALEAGIEDAHENLPLNELIHDDFGPVVPSKLTRQDIQASGNKEMLAILEQFPDAEFDPV